MSLLAAFSFDNASDPGHDDSGNGLDLTLVDGAHTASGHTGGGFSVSSGNGGTVTPFAAVPVAWSVTLWARTTASSGWHSFIQGSDADEVAGLWLEHNGTALDVYFGADTTNQPGDGISGGNLASGTWHHLAATWDGSTLTLYVDGVSRGTQANTGTPSWMTRPMDVAGSGDQPLTGAVDDVRFYDHALTGAEVVSDMNTPVSGGSEDESGASTAALAVTASGSGSAAEAGTGGSTADVGVAASGAGAAVEATTGASNTSLTTTAAGAGASVEHAADASTNRLTVTATGVGSGSEQETHTGSAATTVTVSATGAGTASEHAAGTSAAVVRLGPVGAGQAAEAAHDVATATLTALATGHGHEGSQPARDIDVWTGPTFTDWTAGNLAPNPTTASDLGGDDTWQAGELATIWAAGPIYTQLED